MAVFEGVNFFLAEKLVKDATQLKSLLVGGGGTREFYPSELVSHVIADSLPPPSLGLARCSGSLMLHSDWVHMSSRCGVMLPTAPFCLQNNKLFSNLVFCPSKLPRGDVEKLACLVFYYGGRMQQRLDPAVTHLVTMDTTGAKYESALRHSVKVVTPEWLLDSTDSGKLADEEDYQPQERGRGTNHTRLMKTGNSLDAVASTKCNGDPEEAMDQEAMEQEAVEQVLSPEMEKGDGSVVGEGVDGAGDREESELRDDGGAVGAIVTCAPVRDEEERVKCEEEREEGVGEAVRGEEEKGEVVGGEKEEGEVVGVEEGVVNGENNDMMMGNGEGEMVKDEGVEKGEEVRDGGTSGGEEIEAEKSGHLEVKAEDMSARHEGVVTSEDAASFSEGCGSVPQTPSTAPVPSTPVAAEARGVELTIATGERETLPQLLNGIVFHLTGYQECMEGDTLSKWKEVIVQHGGSVVDTYDSDLCTHLLALHKKSDTFAKAYADHKCISSAHWLNDVLTEGKLFPPRHALHFPTAFKWQVSGAENYSITLTNYTGAERELVKDMVHITGIPYTGHLSKSTSYLISKNSGGKKYDKAVEWGVTVVNVSFLADIIHNGQIPAVLYPRHTRLGLSDEFFSVHCFEATRLLKPWEEFFSRYSPAHSECVDWEMTEKVFRFVKKRRREEEEAGRSPKRQRLGEQLEREAPPVAMLTGISQSIAKKLKATIQKLGGTVTDKPRDCTHLVAPRVARTVKFLCGISTCQYMVTPEWVEQSEREQRFANEEGFTLRDLDAEEAFAMDIPTALTQARGKLLEGYCFYCTPNVQPPRESLREIIQCAGGELLTASEVQSVFGRKLENLASSGSQLLVLSTVEDVASGLCSRFTAHNIPIYNAELVLTGVLKQQLDLSKNTLTS